MTTTAPPVPDHDRPSRHRSPVLRVTFYDRVSSFMMATVAGLFIAVMAIIALSNPTQPPIDGRVDEVEWVSGVGGLESAVSDSTPRVESPEDLTTNASAIDARLSEQQTEEALETVEQLADTAAQQIEQMMSTAELAVSIPGSSNDNGSGPLGNNDETIAGGPEQRWFIQFSDVESIDEYTRQLDFFEIELGALFPDRGELVYLSNMASTVPKTRAVTVADDDRLYMTWQGRHRRAADAELFRRAGVDVTGASVLHFYTRETEELLTRLEHAYADRSARQIRRTYFVVVKKGSGYSFAVTQQRYFR